MTAPRGQSTEIQSRCSLALSGIVKTDNRIYTGFLNSMSGFGKNPILTSLFVFVFLYYVYLWSMFTDLEKYQRHRQDGLSCHLRGLTLKVIVTFVLNHILESVS